MGAPTRSDAASATSSSVPGRERGTGAVDAARGEEPAVDVVRDGPQVVRAIAVEDDGDLGADGAEAGESHAGPLQWGGAEHLNSTGLGSAIFEDCCTSGGVDSGDIRCLCSASPRKDAMSTIVSVDTRDIRFPTSLQLDGSDAMNPDPDYSAAYVVVRTDAGDGLEGHAFVFTIGRGNDVQVAALETLRGHLARPGRRGAPRRHGRRVATTRARLAAALARPREGRHAHGDRGGRQRAVGPARQARRAPAVAAPRRAQPRGARVARRLPLPQRRHHARRGARDPARRRTRPRRAHRAAPRGRVPRATRRRPAGSATPTRSSSGSAARPWPTASRRSSSRSGPTSTTTVRRLAHRTRGGRTRLPDRHRREPALGRGGRRSRG